MNDVYLAGPITGLTYSQATGWRDDPLLHHFLEKAGWRPRSPMRDKDFLNIEGTLPARIDDDAIEQFEVDRDLSDIRQVQAVLANLTGAHRVSIGTMCELGFAFAIGCPIITVLPEEDKVHDHLFVAKLSTTVVETLPEAVTALEELGRRFREPAYA